MRPLGPVLLACALTLAPLSLAGTAQAAQTAAPTAPVSSVVPAAAGDHGHVLPGGGKGPAAIKKLGSRVPQAAALNHLSSARFTRLVESDDTVNLDPDARIYFVDDFEAPAGASAKTVDKTMHGPARPSQDETAPAANGTTTANGTTAADGTDSASTQAAGLAIPALHSRSSTHTIYLDFDGMTLPGTSAWATASSNTIPATTYSGFSLDADPEFNQAEVDYMTKVWRIVAEKYTAWDVDVTTVDPGVAGYTRTNIADTTFGTHVVITDDPRIPTAVCSDTCSGVAYLGVFDNTNNSANDPAWVFSSKTFGSPQVTALTAAHELGHTFGLSHDGDATHAYYSGHANWDPIMGSSGQAAVSQFSKGEYSGANNQEDDLAIIGANGNSGAANSLLIADDYGSGTTPTPLGDVYAYDVDGAISNAADDDLFSIDRTCTSPLTATATGIGAGQSVDLKVDILDTSNNVLASNDPGSGQVYVGAPSIAFEPTGMDATASLPSTTIGTTYRIRIDGVGHDTASTGYTDYGSIGQYHLNITGCPSPNAPGAPATATGTPNARTTTGTISWTAPTVAGTSPVTGYRITGLPGGPVVVGNVLSYNATGLVPGTTYNVTVAGMNLSGGGVERATTIRVATWAPLTKPVLSVTPNGTTPLISWTVPANPGNATLTGWNFTYTSPATGPGSFIVEPQFSGVNFGPLPKSTYTFTVTGQYTADDTAGVVTSDPFVLVISDPASAPATLTATPTQRTTTGTLNWTAPASNGGSTITGYQITGLPGGTVNLGNVLTYGATNLVPGTTYNVAVAAINGVGPGAPAGTTLKVDTWAPLTKPGLSASLFGTTAALLTWTAPANPGGATLTGWRVQETTGSLDEVLAAGTLNKTYFGLAAGTHTYTVTGQYTATDTAGIVASDPASVTVTTIPGAPATLTATPTSRTTTGTLTWTAPTSNGGSAITGYAITGLPGGTVNLGNVLTYGATNLVPGTTYNVAVFAKNVNGTSATSANATLKVDTWAPTTKPGLTTSLAGSTATLTWTAPANPGGATLTGWHVVGTGATTIDDTVTAGTLTKDYAVGYGITSFTVTGSYTATDTAGIVASDPKSVNRGTTIPGGPASAGATPNSRTFTGTVSWTAPSSDGGSPITGYTITGLPGGTVNVGNVLFYGATGLAPGTTYNVSVLAKNANGTSATSADTTLKVDTWAPTAKPGLITSVSGSTATLTWTAPANPGGATLTGWRVQETTGSLDEVLAAGTLTKNYPGLSTGTHTYTVTGQYTADDTLGVVASDPASVTVVATTTPGAPATLTATPTSRTTTGTLNWTAPVSNGGSAITGYKVSGLPGGPTTLGNVLTYNATNLVPGTTYNVDVQAINTNGAGTAKSTTLKVDTWAPTTKPGLTATLSGATATASWTPPANPGGATLTGWHVVATGASPVDETLPAGTLTKDYGVTYGTTNFTVTGTYTATDQAGIIASDPQGVTRATTAPGGPASASATPTPRTTTGTVSWTAPVSNGGSAITGYAITGLPGGNVNLGNVLTYGATNLVPGTTYNVAVFAKNVNGTSATSANATLKVDTWAPTTKPSLTASLAGSTATVTWTAPANPGNATLTGWHVVATGASPVDETLAAATLTKDYTVAAGTTTYTVTGTYTATDLAGIVASDPQAVVWSAGAVVPGAPAGVSATPHPRTPTGTINWTAPTSDGGSPVIGYQVLGLPGGTVFPTTSPYDAFNLVPGTEYNVSVQAVNSVGAGPAATTTLTVATWAPTTKPGLTVTRSGTTATLTWTAPANPGNATLTGWRIHRSGAGLTPADKTVSPGFLTTTMAGLSIGTQTFTVRGIYTATDVAGVQTSDPKSVVVTIAPSAPRIGSASSGAAGGTRNAIARWAAPLSNGGTAITGYKVIAYKIVGGKVARAYTSTLRSASSRAYAFALPRGSYKFRVIAYNKVGASPASAYSRLVTSR